VYFCLSEDSVSVFLSVFICVVNMFLLPLWRNKDY